MVFRLKLSESSKSKLFLQREWLSIATIFTLITLGNRFASTPMLMVAALFIAFTILRSSVENAFYWSIVLIPNIRMLDGMGVSFLVNALMALPIVVYFIRLGARKLPSVAVIGSFVLFAMEFLHDMILCNLENIETIVGWTLNVFLCMLVTADARVNLSKNDVFCAFSTGIIMSAAMYLSAGFTTISYIIETLNSGTRFTAFADDPNYYSLYICTTIACILNVKGKTIYKFCVVLLLIGIGLLTASKMCILLMIFELVLIFSQVLDSKNENRGNKKFVTALLMGIVLAFVVLRDYISVFLENFTRRLGDVNNSSLNLDQLTTGRSTILLDYIGILFSNIACLFTGYGFNYHLFLGQTSGKGAHNTYLDFLLAWGILGTIIFVILLRYWIKTYKQVRNVKKIRFINKIPTIVLLINFLDLSCLSASMFPFVVAIVLIQWLPDKETIE